MGKTHRHNTKDGLPKKKAEKPKRKNRELFHDDKVFSVGRFTRNVSIIGCDCDFIDR
jgi:hypothetical protein